MLLSTMAWSAIVFILASIILCAHSESMSFVSTESNEKANYHLRMLKENVERIKRSWNSLELTRHPSHVFKRSTKHRADDLILNSLSSYCHAFKDDPDITDYLEKSSEHQPLKFRDLSEHFKYEPDINGNVETKPNSFMFPVRELNTIPVKILAQRDEGTQNVWYIFHIAHSNTVEIARIDPFEFQKTTVKMPRNSCYKVISKVRFEVNMTGLSCVDSRGDLKDRLATFQITDEGKSYGVITISLDVCKFDKRRDTRTGKVVTVNEIESVNHVSFPTFSISQSHDPNNNDIPFKNITDNDGEEITFDLEVKLSSFGFSIHLSLWDSQHFTDIVHTSAVVYEQENEYENEKIDVRYKDDGGVLHGNYDDAQDKLFTVKAIGKSSSVTTFRIVLNRKHIKNKSAKLTLSNQLSKSSESASSELVRTVRVDHFLGKTKKHREFPEELVYFGSRIRFFCDGDGDMTGSGMHDDMDSKNCTMKCEAFGRDLSTIYITAPQSAKRRVQLTSLVLFRKAVAFIDLGAASDEIEGDYQCTVVNDRGESKTQEMKLYTSRFVHIKSFEIVDDNSNTLQLLCEVENLNEYFDIAISSSENNVNKIRLDNSEGMFLEKNITHDENTNITSLSLLLSWEHVKAPRDTIHCDARGERGEDMIFKFIGWYYQRSHGRFPKINAGLLKIVTFRHNLTAIATCVASGEMPMTIRIYSLLLMGPLDTTRWTTVKRKIRGNTMSSTYYVDLSIIRDPTDLYCVARNELGRDEQHFPV